MPASARSACLLSSAIRGPGSSGSTPRRSPCCRPWLPHTLPFNPGRRGEVRRQARCARWSGLRCGPTGGEPPARSRRQRGTSVRPGWISQRFGASPSAQAHRHGRAVAPASRSGPGATGCRPSASTTCSTGLRPCCSPPARRPRSHRGRRGACRRGYGSARRVHPAPDRLTPLSKVSRSPGSSPGTVGSPCLTGWA